MNYLEAQADVDAVVRGVGLARAFGASAAYDRVRGDAIEPGKEVTSAADLDRVVRGMSDRIYHAAGTRRMGPASDADAVVDALRRGDPPIMVRVHRGELLVDPHCLRGDEATVVARRLREELHRRPARS